MSRVLGIDGGGSKTLVALADEAGHITRTARGEGTNPLDRRDWRDVLDALIRPFRGEPGLAAVVAALPAHGEVDHLSAAQREAIAAAFGEVPQRVVNDVDGAHLGAFAGGAGVLILSGTGSMAWARDAEGRSYRVGGWGDAIGDEGSSHWIGRRILGRVSQALDGRAEPTTLTDALFEALAIDPADPVNGLGSWVAGLTDPRSEVAALAPIATRLAESGDAGALEIVEEAAAELARHFEAIARLAGPLRQWSYAGGTFASRVLREAVAARIGRPPQPPRLPPIGGALLAAAQLAGWSTGAAWIERLSSSLQSAAEGRDQSQLIN
jgi:N-acetylglucosamine kinase-like BadF-type ATPase